MIAIGNPIPNQERRATSLAVIILLQALCGLFFIGDVAYDLHEGDHLDDLHTMLETCAAVALLVGAVFLMRELRELLNRMAAMDISIRAARGEMANLIESFFAKWKLTPSEHDIALLILKGISNDEIARIRGTASSTVRAQCTKIYTKADVDGRSQLMSIFMEELLNTDETQPNKSTH